MNPNFKDIEPYSDAEVPAAIRRVLLSPLFPYICYIHQPCQRQTSKGWQRT